MPNISVDFHNELSESLAYVVMDTITGMLDFTLNKLVYDTLPEWVEALPSAINHWVWYEDGWKRVIH